VLRAVRPLTGVHPRHAVPELAADAVDEAFARAFARWERVQVMGSPAGWVYRVAVNEARRQLRRAVREETLLDDERRTRPVVAPPPGGEAWLLVDRLPVRQRATVVLRHVAGLTEAEVGVALGVTRSTVSSSLAAAYRSLARQLESGYETGSPARVSREPDLQVAVVRTCGPQGCEVSMAAGDASGPSFVPYSAAVLGTVKVRPGDLVAVSISAAQPRGAEIVWRWWGGRVERIAPDGRSATVSRNVTQTSPDDARRAEMDVALPDELADDVGIGEHVWFGTDEPGRQKGRDAGGGRQKGRDAGGGRQKVVVAVAGPAVEARAAARFPDIRRALGEDFG
jgi:RNA polymerase sigma-70 factor (ECF subfamily)